VTCSKGTYIRSLCRDWGSKLGIPAHMRHLRRTESGRFKVDESVPLDTFESSSEPSQYLLSVWTALREVPQVSVNNDLAEKLMHGQTVRFALPHVTPTSVVAVRAETDGELVATTEVLSVEAGHAWLKPKKVFWKREQ
jgi:tRNA pseudouridine55 synthase